MLISVVRVVLAKILAVSSNTESELGQNKARL